MDKEGYKKLKIWQLSHELGIKVHPVRNKGWELCFILM